MAIGEGEVIQAHPIRRRFRLRVTVLGLMLLVALSALGLFMYSKYFLPPSERPTIVVEYRKISPASKSSLSPWLGKEDAWKFALKLEPKWSLFSWW